MKKYKCLVCGYEYDPEAGDPANGIEPGTAFEDLPDDWTCSVCGAGHGPVRGDLSLFASPRVQRARRAA